MELFGRIRRHAKGAFGPEATAGAPASPPTTSSSGRWEKSSTFGGHAKGRSGSALNAKRPPIDYCMGAAKPNATSRANATPRPAVTSTATGSKRETNDEISGRQTLHRDRWP